MLDVLHLCNVGASRISDSAVVNLEQDTVSRDGRQGMYLQLYMLITVTTSSAPSL